MRKSIIMLLLLSGIVFAGRVGLVIQLNENELITKCVTIPIDESVKAGCTLNGWCSVGTGNSTAETVLINSGLKLMIGNPDPCFGKPLCKIEDVGCDASNCLCSSNFWGFFYLLGGSWQLSECGISGFNVRDGDVVGFSGTYFLNSLLPSMHSFSGICPSSASQSGGEQIRYFSIAVDGNCSKKPFMINVKEKMGGTIWEPTAFLLSANLGDIRFENGVGIKVLLHQTYFGKDAGFEKTAMLFTDKEGNTSFIPEKPGRYKLEFNKEGFLGEEREIDINECKAETAVVNESLEELGSEKKEVEPNISRVDITAPPTAVINSTVVLRMVSDTGKPLAYESMVVEFSGGRKELITDKNGEATFSAEREGVYSYSSPNHTLSAYRVTNVIEQTRIALKNPAAMPVVERGDTPQSVGMAVANPLQNTLAALFGGAIVLVSLLALRKMRKW